MQQKKYYIKGMHCPACETLIERKIAEVEDVAAVDVSLTKGTVDIEGKTSVPDIEALNRLFKENGYSFAEKEFTKETGKWRQAIAPIAIAILAIIVFFVITNLGLASFINISADSSLLAFFVFGLIAGLSSCAALVGGLILSLAKQWNKEFSQSDTFWEKAKPHLLFNAGRLLSFTILGGLLGYLGEKFIISPTIAAVLIILVSVVMIIMALQMLGVTTLNRFRLVIPKSVGKKVLQEEKRSGRLAPLVVGFLTFLLPCGFTLITEGAAVLSADAWQGALIMLMFVLGTALPLLAIGLFSVKLLSNNKLADKFLKVAGILIIFFVAYNLNVQFGLSDYFVNRTPATATNNDSNNQQPIQSVNQNEQLIKAVYTEANDIAPNTFTIKVGQRVRFEVDVQDNGSGCMSTIMIPGLWNQAQKLVKGQTIVMEFTPDKIGTYQITCAMGVPRGTIKVIN